MSRLRAARRALRQAATLLRECSSLESQALVDLARVSQASHLSGLRSQRLREQLGLGKGAA